MNPQRTNGQMHQSPDPWIFFPLSSPHLFEIFAPGILLQMTFTAV